MSEIDEIPKGWEYLSLGTVCKLKNGFAFKSSHYLKDAGIPVIRISDIGEGKVILKDCVRVFEKKELDNFIVLKDDILVAMSGATTGKFGIYRGEDKVYQNQRVGKFEILCKEVLNNSFLLYLLYALKHKILEDAYGGAQPNISSGKIEELQINLPPLPEQHRIVAKIEELFSSLDKGIESLKTAQAQLKVYRQAVLKWAFEGKLTNENVIDGELPEGWKWKKLKDLGLKISDGPFGSHLKSVDYVDAGVRVIRLENIGEMKFRNEYKTFVSNEKYESIKKHTVGRGDIIFSSFISDCIRTVILPDYIEKAVNKSDCFLIRTNETTIRTKFLALYLSTKAMHSQLVNHIHGATRPRINTTQLKESNIPLSSLPEQDKIVQEIESRLSVCDKIEETITTSLLQAEALRQSILKKAFEGKLVPQDPNDEPAAKLLKRIKADRI